MHKKLKKFEGGGKGRLGQDDVTFCSEGGLSNNDWPWRRGVKIDDFYRTSFVNGPLQLTKISGTSTVKPLLSADLDYPEFLTLKSTPTK